MQTIFDSAIFSRASHSPRGFSLVEVTLAVAIVAIGIVGIMALFPLGMDATRKAADDTQMMTIGQDWIAYYQQMAAQYSLSPSEVSANESYSKNMPPVDGIYYHVKVVVTNAGFSTIFDTDPIELAKIPANYAKHGNTNMISRFFSAFLMNFKICKF